MLGVLFDSDVEERGPQPLQSHRDVSDCVEHNLSIEVLYQMVVETGEKGRDYLQKLNTKSK